MTHYIWVIVEKFGNVLLKVAGMIFMARILQPQDFGLFGMIFVLVALGNVIVDSGMGGALIKKQHASEIDYSTVFTFNIAMSSMIWMLFYFSSNKIAAFYEQPRLAEIIPILSLIIPIRSLGLIPITRLTKDLKFKVQSNISLLSYFFSFIIGYTFASFDYGVYSLIYMSLSEVTLIFIFSYIISKHKISLKFSLKSWKELYPFGVKLTLASLVRTIYENSINVIFGKMFGVNTLGYYYQASKINDTFVNTSTTVINKAAFPILARNVNSPEIKVKMRNLLSVGCWLTFIVCLIISTNSSEIIKFLLGTTWLESAWMLSIISLSGFGMIVEAITRSFLKAHGYAGDILRLELKKRSIALGLILISTLHGVEFILIMYVLTTIISALFNILTVASKIEYSIKEQFYDIAVPLFYILVVYICISTANNMLSSNGIVSFLVNMVITSLIYGTAAFAHNRNLIRPESLNHD